MKDTQPYITHIKFYLNQAITSHRKNQNSHMGNDPGKPTIS